LRGALVSPSRHAPPSRLLYREFVRKLYSSFPLALPGLGLVTLRVVLALSIAQEALRGLGVFDRSGLGAYLVYSVALIVLTFPVAVGFLTPIVHVIVALVETAMVIVERSPEVSTLSLAFTNNDPRILQVAIAVAVALLGPGVYSVDSHLFGRHEIVIRPRQPSGPPARTRK
jgi:hypothetical protein